MRSHLQAEALHGCEKYPNVTHDANVTLGYFYKYLPPFHVPIVLLCCEQLGCTEHSIRARQLTATFGAAETLPDRCGVSFVCCDGRYVAGRHVL